MAKKKVDNVIEMEQTEHTEVKAEETVVEIPTLTLEDFKEKVTVKERIGFLEKQALIQSVYDGCVKKDEANGIYYIDYITLDVYSNLAMLGMYTDYYEVIEYANNYSYDYLDEIGIFNYVFDIVVKDFINVKYAIEEFETRVADLNSIGSCLYRIINEALVKLPDVKDINKLINNLPKAINKIDKDTLSIFAKELGNGTITHQVIGKNKE